MSHSSQPALRIFAWPALIALLGALGLFAALLGDGWWDGLSWLGLGPTGMVLDTRPVAPLR
ncbi:hypothetical protein TCK1_326 [Pseudomonas monteilii]|uniref:Uncharacterized protein n=1 Tax=Pseudomonas monteilii TaxID=76759 RepID=A0AAE6V0W5_9PSED|nr:hypothetical protein [Pseudomonas monteilii]QHB25672.1 hypothetical protein TCK1_326 [Pseudomonas monteilii]